MELSQLLNIVWVMVGSVLVFFMQAGFAMVETGFTRAKNASNIIMKNVMDFTIGSIVFYLIGFSLMFGDSIGGIFGGSGFLSPEKLGLSVFADLTPPVFIFFQTVFCATAATLVSGAVAERTKFLPYLIFSAVISMVIYPVVGHWIWGGGWLSKIGFVDFAGSTVVHSVGGWAALVGAAMVGPRIGKYVKGKVNALPGHNITLGALGVFILWMCWFGFNAGSTLGATDELGHIAMTTNLAACAAAFTTMLITWIRYGKPDVSMTLNGVLAGLVAITAGCQVVSIKGALVIGIVAGFLIVLGIEFIDKVVKVDDPVGAVGVHCLNGVAGTLMVGLFANYMPGTESAITGLFYGGGFSLLGEQALGAASVAAWTIGTSFVLFGILKKTVGLRVTEQEETIGLDIHEHNTQAYADFMVK
jgi:Amt family ammonium transporter